MKQVPSQVTLDSIKRPITSKSPLLIGIGGLTPIAVVCIWLVFFRTTVSRNDFLGWMFLIMLIGFFGCMILESLTKRALRERLRPVEIDGSKVIEFVVDGASVAEIAKYKFRLWVIIIWMAFTVGLVCALLLKLMVFSMKDGA
jgi:hypothetical protein